MLTTEPPTSVVSSSSVASNSQMIAASSARVMSLWMRLVKVACRSLEVDAAR
jgi:hypothetical protein